MCESQSLPQQKAHSMRFLPSFLPVASVAATLYYLGEFLSSVVAKMPV